MFAAICAILFTCWIIFRLVRCVYRLTFHPLSRVPGPKLAALSRAYEFYYQVVVGGGFEDQIRFLHESYSSPIVRVGPNEVHVNDPEYYDTIFSFNPHLDKRKYAMDNLQHTPSHAQHKLRRYTLESFFSRGSILTLEWVVKHHIEALCKQLDAAREASSPCNMSLLYRCLTTDFITEYCFGRNYGFLQDPESSKPFFAGIDDAFKQIFLKRESTTWENITNWTLSWPEFMLPPRESKTGAFLHVARDMWTDAQNAMGRDAKAGERRTIFTEFPKNEKLPPSEKTERIIYYNAIQLVVAGYETSAHVLETATFHLNVPENICILEKLRSEIVEIWPNAEDEIPSWLILEKLPYLQAVIKEALRLSLGVSTRLSRINHHEAMIYNEWLIPAGYEISMSQSDLHFNDEIFPDPWAFKPDRWLGEKAKSQEKYLVTFSRGSRACLGMSLAMCELNSTLATVVRRYDFKLFDTDRREVDYKYDYFVPHPESEKGVRVEVL